MNFSEIEKIKPQIYNYLGFHSVGKSAETDSLIVECINELDKISQFNYLYRLLENVPDFLEKEPYKAFLSGSTGTILSAMTLGIEVDRRINQLFRIDMSRAVVFDSCASAYLEFRSDEFERHLGLTLSARFCPGYGGSSVDDLKYIFEILHPEKIGISLSESCFMLPSKSMAGIIAVGKINNRSCAECFMLNSCNYIKDGVRCYDPTGK